MHWYRDAPLVGNPKIDAVTPFLSFQYKTVTLQCRAQLTRRDARHTLPSDLYFDSTQECVVRFRHRLSFYSEIF